MKYMGIGCNINCWECKKKCEIKELLELSIHHPFIEQPTYAAIMESLKAQAGLLIVQGKNPKIIDEELQITAVSFYVARLKMKEQLNPKKQN